MTFAEFMRSLSQLTRLSPLTATSQLTRVESLASRALRKQGRFRASFLVRGVAARVGRDERAREQT